MIQQIKKWITFFVVAVALMALVQKLAFEMVSRRVPLSEEKFQLSANGSGSYYSISDQMYYELAYQPSMTATGTIMPTSLVRIRLDEDILDEVLPDPNGNFTATVNLIEEGRNVIVAEGPLGSKRSVPVWYLPGRGPGPTPITRSLHLTLSPGLASLRYVTSIPTTAENADFSDLIMGTISPGLFIKRIFYPFNDDFTGSELLSISEPETSIDGGLRTVVITGTVSGWRYHSKNINDILRIHGDAVSSNTLTLALDRVSLLPPLPAPDRWANNELTWSNLDEPSDIKVIYDLNSRIGPIAQMWGGVREQLDNISRVSSLLITLATPIIPFIWFLTLKDQKGWARLQTLSFLSVMMWAVPVIAVLIAIFSGHSGSENLAFWVWPLTYCVLLIPIYWATALSREAGGRLFEALKWVVIALLALLLFTGLPLLQNYLFQSRATITLMGIIVFLSALWLGYQFTQLGQAKAGLFPRLRTVGWAVLLLIPAIFAFPTSAALFEFYPIEGWDIATWQEFYFIFAIFLLPYLALVGLLAMLNRRGTEAAAKPDPLLMGIGHLVFAFYLIGTIRGATLTFITTPVSESGTAFPVAFLLAWLVVYRILIQKRECLNHLDSISSTVLAKRANLIQKILDVEWAKKMFDKNLHAGKITLSDYENQKGVFNTYLMEKRRCVDLPKGVVPKDVIFAFGPAGSSWENAKLACRYGLILMIPLILLYSPSILTQAMGQLETPFLLLAITAVSFVPFFLKWILYSFFLGYFFPYIRGKNGWQKGFLLSLAITACTLSHDLILRANSMNDVVALLFDAGQTVLFFSILGIWAFDYQTLRRNGHGWRELAIVHDAPALATFSSSLLLAISSAITTIITGRITNILTTLIDTILPKIKIV